MFKYSGGYTHGGTASDRFQGLSNGPAFLDVVPDMFEGLVRIPFSRSRL